MNKGVKIGMRMLTGKVSTSLGGGGGCSTLELPEVINNYVTSPHNTHNYITLQKGDENTQTYQVEAVILISHQILINNSQKCVAARGEIQQSDLGI